MLPIAVETVPIFFIDIIRPINLYGNMRDIAVILLILILLSGCDLFKVRDSDPPGAAPPWIDFANEWDSTLLNLEYVYEDYRNAIKYSGLFSTDYVFHFAPQDISDFSMPNTWTRTLEQDMIQLLHNRYEQIQVELTDISGSDQIGASEVKIYRAYLLTGIQRTKAPSFVRQTLASGNLELQLRKTGGFWYIYKWYDYRSDGNITWGRLKYENSSS